MHDKEFRNLFLAVLGLGLFVSFLWTVTTIVPDPGGISQTMRLIVCGGLTVIFALALGLDLFGIWTGHLPSRHHHPRH
jgi:hypothetical protein